ncbi:PH domain-containing protein [Streptomyces sp. NPDC002088]|uniref:PH domain-containing protein n=1 Tax=Streptomyces sp. NPDC002088 TaxID=3154665 RepID=UPI00331D9EE5
MTTPEHQSPAPQPSVPGSRDRIYRSAQGLVGGVLLLALGGWLGIDALFSGHGSTPWLALAAMILFVPLVVAFTLRPAVFANNDRLRVRNPFRVVVVPWGEVASLRSAYSNEVVTKSGTKYQLWAVPVSLRARKRAVRQQTRAESGGRRGGLFGGGGVAGGLGGMDLTGGAGSGPAADVGPVRAETDKIMDELREMLKAREKATASQGEVTVRWAYEVMGPMVVGAVLLAVLLAVK